MTAKPSATSSEVSGRAQGGRMVRVLCPDDLAVFEAMFDRLKDWVDIDAMDDANTLDQSRASSRLAGILAVDDPRIARLATRVV